MEFLQPTSLAEALDAKRAYPDAVPISGGTDVMVELNFDRQRPERIIDLNRVAELAEWGAEGGRLRIGAGVTYTRLIAELGERLPGLAIASRTVGSPQIPTAELSAATSAPPRRPATACRPCSRQTPRLSWSQATGGGACRWTGSSPGQSATRSHRGS